MRNSTALRLSKLKWLIVAHVTGVAHVALVVHMAGGARINGAAHAVHAFNM
jgi:hypothetical protein